MKKSRNEVLTDTDLLAYSDTDLRVRITQARLAQSAERKTLNLVVVGSSPTLGGWLFFFGGGMMEWYGICGYHMGGICKMEHGNMI